MKWWIEWYYNAANKLEGKIVAAAAEPNPPVPTTSSTGPGNIVAVTGPYGSQGAAQAKLSSQAGESAPSNFQALTQAGGSLLGLPTFSASQLRSWGIRALKVLIGLALVVVGLVQLTHAGRLVGDAAAVAKAVP